MKRFLAYLTAPVSPAYHTAMVAIGGFLLAFFLTTLIIELVRR